MSADSSRVTTAARRRHLGLVTLGIGALLAPMISATDITPAQASGSAAITVTGGDVTDYDGYRYHLFTHTGDVGESTDHTLTVTGNPVIADVLVVAGGGGGGRNRAGGGGAGGLLNLEGEELTVGDYSITVGGGGKGGFPAEAANEGSTPWNAQHYSPGCRGEGSSFDGESVDGGGGGGAKPTNTNEDTTVVRFDCDGKRFPEEDSGENIFPNGFSSGQNFEGQNGGSGGSGGGGAYLNGLAGESTANDRAKGNTGGAAGSRAGGGGGAGQPGADGTSSSSPGNGGDGLATYSVFGIATNTGEEIGGARWFAGGGGGFSGGGGGKGGGKASASTTNFSTLDGSPHTGGGGGACANAVAGCRGGHGGSGVVIVRYEVPHFTELEDPHTAEATLTRSFDFGGTLPPIGLTGADSVEVLEGELPPGISLVGLVGPNINFEGAASESGTFTFALRAFKEDPGSGPTLVTDRSVEVTVTAIAPGVPTVTDTVARANSAIFTITPPASNGGSEIIRYEAQIGGAGEWITLEPSDLGLTLRGLQPDTPYSVTIRAVNGAGAGNATGAITFTTANLPVFVSESFSSLPQTNWLYGGRNFTPVIADNALRLTRNENGLGGSAIYLLPQSPNAGLDVRFKFAMFGGNGADGLTFFLMDGEESNPTIGALGGSLGYRFSSSSDGLTSALLGIGFDAWGGFGATDSTNSGCPVGITGTTARNLLVARGPGSGRTGYCLLAPPVRNIDGQPTYNAEKPWNWHSGTPNTKPGRTHDVQIIVDSANTESPKVRVRVDGVEHLVVNQPTELRNANSFLFGFAASTGGSNNNHDIWDLEVGTLAELPPMAFVTDANLPAAGTGSVYNQALRVRNGLAPYSFQLAEGSALPSGLTLNQDGTISGTPEQPLTEPVSFTVNVTDNQTPPDQTSRTFTLTVEADQVLEVGAIATQDRRLSTIQAVGTSVAAGTTTPTGLPITWASTTPGVCAVDESGLISLIARGACTITANQPGGIGNGFNVNAAPQITRTFTVTDTALESLTLSAGSLQPALNNTATAYQVSVPNSVSSLTFTPASRFTGAVIGIGGAPVASGEESDPVALAVGQNVVTLTISDGDSITTITVTITRAAPPAPPTSPATNQAPRPTPPAVTPPAPGALTIPRPPTTSPVLGSPPPAPVATGPVITGGQPPRPTGQTTATVGGTPRPVSQAPIGSTGVRVTAGTLDIGVRVNSPQQGTVRTTPQGTPELVVVKGQQTVISGSGVAPGSTVQAFLPLGGTNAIELGRIQADATGTFSGDAVLNTPLTQAPLPIGRQVLQILGVDEDGNRTVVNMTINIAQPPPQPEINREDQEVPTLGVGQSLATEAGVPVAVTVTPVPENNQTLIEGDGWTMGISVAGEGAEVEETSDGEVVLKLVRDETASVSGRGFMPLTRADVWLFSEPTLLGTVDIDENGEFNGVVNVDGNVVTVGEHTLQLQGVGQDGYVRAANLGVVVGENPELVPTTTATSSLTWLLWAIALFAVAAIIALFWWLRRQGATNS